MFYTILNAYICYTIEILTTHKVNTNMTQTHTYMSKKLILPRGFTTIIKEKLKDKYSISYILKVKRGLRDNLEIKKALLELSQEYSNELKELQQMEESIINS